MTLVEGEMRQMRCLLACMSDLQTESWRCRCLARDAQARVDVSLQEPRPTGRQATAQGKARRGAKGAREPGSQGRTGRQVGGVRDCGLVGGLQPF